MQLRQLEQQILAVGKVDGQTLELLRKQAYAGGKIDRQTADLLVEGQLMREVGTFRIFESPPLEPASYTYTVRARWRQNGAERDQTQVVQVRPGQVVTVRFEP